MYIINRRACGTLQGLTSLGFRVQGFAPTLKGHGLGKSTWVLIWVYNVSYPYPQRTHVLRLLGPKTLLYKAFGLF